MESDFLDEAAITSLQNSRESNSKNVTTLQWAKPAKRLQALSLSEQTD